MELFKYGFSLFPLASLRFSYPVFTIYVVLKVVRPWFVPYLSKSRICVTSIFPSHGLENFVVIFGSAVAPTITPFHASGVLWPDAASPNILSLGTIITFRSFTTDHDFMREFAGIFPPFRHLKPLSPPSNA